MAERLSKKTPTTFIWEGLDQRGARVQGEMKGATLALVKAELRRQGISPSNVKKKSPSLFSARGTKRITPKDIAILSRQLATMISAGVPLMQCFEIIGQGHENPRMQKLALAIRDELGSGNSLSDALEKYPAQFSELYRNLVRVGEQGGILEEVMHKIAHYMEKTESIRGKVKKALFYPAAVVVVAFVVTTILLVFVIPQFASLFERVGSELPWLTQWVIWLSEIFQEWWWIFLGGLGGSVFILARARKRFYRVRRSLDWAALQIPIIGPILHKSAIARFTRTLSTMFAAGVPLVEAMDSVAGTTGNLVYTEAVLRMRGDMAAGQRMQEAMSGLKLFPVMVSQMVAIGEETGSLDTMLAKVADFYEEEVDNSVDSLSSLIEPLIIVVLGVLIGGLVIAMYLPIFYLGRAI